MLACTSSYALEPQEVTTSEATLSLTSCPILTFRAIVLLLVLTLRVELIKHVEREEWGMSSLQSGCLVVNAPTANTIAAAEHGIALIAALSRNVAQADASVKAGKWERTKFVGVSIIGKTLAIMGFGKVPSTFWPYLHSPGNDSQCTVHRPSKHLHF